MRILLTLILILACPLNVGAQAAPDVPSEWGQDKDKLTRRPVDKKSKAKAFLDAFPKDPEPKPAVENDAAQ